jgi:hypothetical protein
VSEGISVTAGNGLSCILPIYFLSATTVYKEKEEKKKRRIKNK